jgi:hypothetical protein
MNRDDIIRMAREAGLIHFYDSEGHCTGITDAPLITEDLDRNDSRLVEMLAPFAALVAAAEREEIAQMIEDSPPLVSFAQNEMGGCVVCGFTPKLAALTIRERGAP